MAGCEHIAKGNRLVVLRQIHCYIQSYAVPSCTVSCMGHAAEKILPAIADKNEKSLFPELR